ncbi:MAG: hypothetical protein DI551_11080 [Micavibrio aeruginosavorus]|uniref:DUF4852 domain-containing protein n=1 Tax=Micavibrio aeruginosavorus TaxID=349221 RepID=A0A2W5MZ88_9BACT|nr:MAG: hypothetical protein DI551_11080 [Micavibrio aeruginosavorus]
MKLDSIFRIFSVLCALLIFQGPAQAQGEQSVPPATKDKPVAQQSLPSDDAEVTILRDEYAGKYSPASLQNLSKLYWRLGAFDFDDTAAVGNYLKINDCKIYTEYTNDDLEWKEIVQVMKKHLEDNSPSFPLTFQFILELHLGRYDPERGGFEIVDRTGFKDAKRIEVASIDTNREICYDYAQIPDYPRSLIVLPTKPFTIDFVELDEHVAQAYILRKKSEYSRLDESQRVRRYERDAYLRLRVTFSQYHGNLMGERGQLMSILYGRIDGYDVFEDSNQKRLMLSVNLEDATKEAPKMSIPKPQESSAPETAPTPAQ